MAAALGSGFSGVAPHPPAALPLPEKWGEVVAASSEVLQDFVKILPEATAATASPWLLMSAVCHLPLKKEGETAEVAVWGFW